ncbi:MAG: DUF4382 domain-containing protein [Nanoarchaeota archaeon]
MLIIGVLALFLLAVGCVPSETATGEQEGRVVFTITDAAADMGAVTSVMVTVDSVSVHSTTEGWLTVVNQSQTFDLLKLKAEGSQELLADVTLKEGTYQQLRLAISKVVVVDADGEHEAKLPSGELKIVGELEVKADSTSTATFDFIADESLHVTGNGEYILAPVVQLDTKTDAEVEVKEDKKVEVKGGKAKTSVKVGMDAEGNVGEGLGIPAKAKLSIGQGKVKVEDGSSLGKGKEAATEDNTSAETEA